MSLKLLLMLGHELSELGRVSLSLLIMLDQQFVSHGLRGRLQKHLAIVFFRLYVLQELCHFFLVTVVNQLLEKLSVLSFFQAHC